MCMTTSCPPGPSPSAERKLYNRNSSFASKGRAENGKVVIFCGDPPQRKDTTQKRTQAFLRNNCPSGTSQNIFYFYSSLQEQNVVTGRKAIKSSWFWLSASQMNTKLLTMKTGASTTSAKSSHFLMQKQQQSQKALYSPQDQKTRCISMH